jgi:hypothetical protein
MGPIDFINNTLKSLTSKDEGFSWRKLASSVVLGLVVYLHIKYVTSNNVLSFILYDFGFIAVLLGLLNLDRFIQAKFGGTTSTDIPGSESQPVDNPGN